MFVPFSVISFIVVVTGCPNVASVTPGLRGGKIGTRDHEEQGRPVFRDYPFGEENDGVFRSIRRRDDDAKHNLEQGLKLAAACDDARDKVRNHTEQSKLQELLLAAQIACNTWFAWTDDTVPDVEMYLSEK
jgi:hypothetical protein